LPSALILYSNGVKTMRTIKVLTTLCLTTFAAMSFAEVSVIVHPSNAATVDATAIERIFLGKEKSFSNGAKAVPVNLESSAAEREEFETKVLDKSPAQLKAYWSKLIFTGKGTQPAEASVSEMIELVSSNPNIIGYVPSSAVTDAVKVVHTAK